MKPHDWLCSVCADRMGLRIKSGCQSKSPHLEGWFVGDKNWACIYCGEPPMVSPPKTNTYPRNQVGSFLIWLEDARQ